MSPDSPQNSKIKVCQGTYLGVELMKDSLHQFSDEHKDKAILHTWLAWQKKPGLSLGQAISERYRALLDDKKANDFITWLQKLFK